MWRLAEPGSIVIPWFGKLTIHLSLSPCTLSFILIPAQLLEELPPLSSKAPVSSILKSLFVNTLLKSLRVNDCSSSWARFWRKWSSARGSFTSSISQWIFICTFIVVRRVTLRWWRFNDLLSSEISSVKNSLAHLIVLEREHVQSSSINISFSLKLVARSNNAEVIHHRRKRAAGSQNHLRERYRLSLNDLFFFVSVPKNCGLLLIVLLMIIF